MNQQDLIIDSLYKIICTATSPVGDSRVDNNDYFKRRVLGFKAEIEFEKLLSKNSKEFFDGGQFLSIPIDGSTEKKNSFLYTTISHDDPTRYKEIYEKISKWEEVKDLVFIRINSFNGTEELTVKENGVKFQSTIIVPEFTFFIFNRVDNNFTPAVTQGFPLILENFITPEREPAVFGLRKREQFEYFKDYDIKALQNIYANRYFLDVILRRAKGRGIIDIDGFIKIGEEIVIVEIKEKSPITNTDDTLKWHFGWDSRRILWYLYINKALEMKVLYNVREINDRTSRKFIKWNSIFLSDFLKGASWGKGRPGGGGEDTMLAPYLYFRNIENILFG